MKIMKVVGAAAVIGASAVLGPKLVAQKAEFEKKPKPAVTQKKAGKSVRSK